MKKKVVWLVVSCLMVLALVLASCAPAVVEEEEVVEEEVVEEEVAPVGPEMVRDSMGRLVEKPQYGGTYTIVWYGPDATLVFDPAIATRPIPSTVHTYSRMCTADWSKGPSGTNECPFSSSYIADEFLIGDLAESWEILDLQTMIFHLRQGVYWQNVPPVNGREFTADDVVFTAEYYQNHPQSTAYQGPEVPEERRGRTTKIDKYTVEMWGPDPNVRMLHETGNWSYKLPHEIADTYGDFNDWRHQCGTGPFMLVDCVPDSSVTWKRNPTYYQMDPFFPENSLPYIDKLKAIVITDESTRMAALRTHKVDRVAVSWDKVEGMKETNPELRWRQVINDNTHVIFVRTDIEPFSDVRVRQAIALAIDQPLIAEEYYMGNAEILQWPVNASFVGHYTPLAELPDNLRELYEHHPDKAKALLAEAGYPTGFKTEIMAPATAPRWVDVLAIVKEQLAEAGIDADINVVEVTTFTAMLYGRTYPSMIYCYWSNNALDDCFGWAHGGWVGEGGAMSVYNFSGVVDPAAVETFDKVQATADAAEREKLRKAQNLHEIEMVWEIPVPTESAFFFYMPWIKGYSGEVGLGPDPGENAGIVRYIWLDRDLKYEITGIRE